MSFAKNWTGVPTIPMARANAAAFLNTIAGGSTSPGGTETSLKTPPADTQVFMLGPHEGQRFRGADIAIFGSGADGSVVTIPEIGIIDGVSSKENGEIDAYVFQPLFQTCEFTLSAAVMSSAMKTELGLSGTIRYADTVAVTTKTTLWTGVLKVESGRDMYAYSPANDTIGFLRIPYTADAMGIYVHRGTQNSFGILARPYGRK